MINFNLNVPAVFFAATERAIFWMISVRHTTGCVRIQMTRLVWCRGGIMVIRSLAWATGQHWLITIHGITVTLPW